ncbi:MAG: hypothetical protein LBE17_10650 [Treponema sp.]|jgi:hypothetical protein|nr:hypothetical protein [Treponema sp.]
MDSTLRMWPLPPQKTRFPAAFVLCAAVLVFASCSGTVDGVVNQDGSAEIELEIALGNQMAGRLWLLNSILRGGAQDAQPPLLDGPAIALSMAAAPGISAVSLRNKSPTAVAGAVSVSRIDAFLSLPARAGGAPFIRYDPAGRVVISLDLETGPQLLSLLSEDVRDYLSTLAAPVATGIPLTTAVYREIVASLHGPRVADEIAAARIPITIEFPRPVKEVRGGAAQGRRARFDLPLIDLLVLERPLMYEVTW